MPEQPRAMRAAGVGLLLLPVLIAGIAGIAGCGGRRGAPAPEAAQRSSLVLRDVRVIDVARGEVSEPRSVVIDGERIAQIGEAGAVTVPAGATIVDGGGRFLMPGLVDMHVHLFDRRGALKQWMGPLFLAHGVTSVREMAARGAWLPALQQSEPLRAQVRVAAVGVVVGAASAPGRSVAEEVAEAKAAGATFLKVFSEVPAARWRQLVDEADRRELPVIGHVPAQVALFEAARAGQRGDEHLTQVFEACTPREAQILEERGAVGPDQLPALLEAQEPAVLDGFDETTCFAVAEQLAATGQVHAPTLILPFVEQTFGAHRFEEDPRWTSLSATEQARWQRIARELTPQLRSVAARRWAVAQRITRLLLRAGVPIVAGTDAPQPYVYPGSSLHEELALLVAVGMSPAQAVRAATLLPAQVLGLAEQQGRVAVGMRAELLLLDGDPLDDIHNTRRIHGVIFAGRWHGRAALDALLRR